MIKSKKYFSYIYLITLLQLCVYIDKVNAQTTHDLFDSDKNESVIINSDSLVINFLSESGVPTTTYNKVKILKSGEEKFHDLFDAIEQATHHIHLEYFNFRNDSIGNELFKLLAKKAAQGVEVRTVFDAFGNLSNNLPLKKKHLKAIRATGVEIYKFDPICFPYLNHVFHRDHRKIAIIDGKIAYTGGMNVADYYIKGLPKIGAWYDTHMRIEGEAVKYLQDIFFTIWNKCAKQKINGKPYYPDININKEVDNDAFKTSIAIVDRAPKKTPKLMRRTYVKAIKSAQKKIQIVNPYFLPTHSIRKELKKAIERGIDLEIMISSKADIGFTPEGSVYVAHNLMKRGADVYLYNGGFHHSKIMMIDNRFCTIGTTNLNSRSLRFDYEVNAFVFDKKTTDELTEVFENDKANCTQLTREVWKKRSRWKRFVGWCANIFTPLL